MNTGRAQPLGRMCTLSKYVVRFSRWVGKWWGFQFRIFWPVIFCQPRFSAKMLEKSSLMKTPSPALFHGYTLESHHFLLAACSWLGLPATASSKHLRLSSLQLRPGPRLDNGVRLAYKPHFPHLVAVWLQASNLTSAAKRGSHTYLSVLHKD